MGFLDALQDDQIDLDTNVKVSMNFRGNKTC